jgi:hypothetical protein
MPIKVDAPQSIKNRVLAIATWKDVWSLPPVPKASPQPMIVNLMPLHIGALEANVAGADSKRFGRCPSHGGAGVNAALTNIAHSFHAPGAACFRPRPRERPLVFAGALLLVSSSRA